MLKRRTAAQPASHEDIFIQRYRWLMESALRLTSRDQEQAEDLVHDVFIHFTLDRPDLSELSISDYDFIADGLQAVEQRTQQVQDELRRICEYACARKDTSKAGAVLILRFFHGYYPEEIAKVLRGTRPAADKWLQIARSEAKLYLSDPSALSFIGQSAAELPITNSVLTTEDFVNELRNAIFKSRDEECFTVDQLRELYLAKESASIDGRALAHIVSCRRCLDEVNQVLGLPLLSSRYPTRTLTPDRHKKDQDGGSGSGGASGGTGDGTGRDDFLSRSRRRKKKVLEHRPQQLRIAVNGFIVGSQDVAAELNKQTVSLKGEEKVGFVEIFSEQEVRLLFSNIEAPPDGPIEHKKRVELSDHRSLELTLDFSESWPNVHVVYHDPTFATAESLVSTESGSDRVLSEPPAVAGGHSRHQARGRLSGWVSDLKRRLADVRHWSFDFGLFTRPSTVTAIVAALLVAVLVFVNLRHPITPVSAAELLQKSALAEEAIAARTDQVLHRTINLEEKSLTGALLARRKIDVWHSAERGITARRLYDEGGALVAGDWRRADGVQTLYHHRATPKLQTPNPQSAIRNFEDVWQLDPSAKAFSSLIANARPSVEERDSVYVISAESADGPASSPVNSDLVRATLVLNRADLHAVEQTLVIKQGTETREYRFTEIGYERRAPQTVYPAVFEPEPELLSSAKLETSNARRETVSPSSVTPSPPAATASLEVEVLRLLGQIGADLGQEVNVKREADGALHIEAITDSAKRKAEIVSALAPVARDPAVKIRIETTTEAQARIQRESRRAQARNTPSEVSQEAPTTNAIPVDAEVRRYLQSKGIAERQLDDEISRLSNRMLNRSHQAMLHAFAMKSLVERFSADDLRSLDPAARAKWLSMIGAHAASFQREAAAIRQDLTPIFGSVASSASADESIDALDDAALFRSVSRLAQLASSMNESIQLSFTISAGSRNAAVRTPVFWRSLKSAEQLADRIVAVAR